MVINKKIKRNMIEHKITYIISIALLILSSMLFTMFNSTVSSVRSAVEQYKKNCNIEDLFFTSSLELDDLDDIKKEYNLEIEEIQWKDVKVLNNINVRVYKQRKKINLHEIVDGSNLQKEGQIVINPEFYSENNMNFGDKITIQDKKFTLAGASVSPDYLYMLENDTSLFCNKETFAVAFISEEDFDTIENSTKGYSVVFNEKNLEDFKEDIKSNYGLISWIEKEDNSKIKAIDGFIDAFDILGKYLPIGIMVIVSLIISIILWKLIQNEINQLGTLYAIGYTKGQLLRHYMSYPIVIGIIGTVLGQIPGCLMIDVLKKSFDIEYTLPKIDIKINFIVILLAIVIPCLIIIILNYIVITKALNHTIVDLMKGKLKEEGPNFLERKIPFNKLEFKTRFKFKDIIKNFGRSILTILAIIFSSFLLFMVFVVSSSMNDVIKDGYDDTIEYNNLYMLSNMSMEETEGERFWNILATTTNKEGKEVRFTIESREKNSKLVNLYDSEDNRISFKNVIITISLAKKLNVKEGDQIKIKSKLDDTVFNVKIDKITDYYLSEKLYIPLEKIYEYTEISEDSYIGVQSKEKLEFDEDEISNSTTKEDMIDGVNNMLSPLKDIMYFIGIISLVIGISVIYIVISMLINENRINISMFKIIGYDNKNLTKIILNTNDILIVIGFILSIPISKYLLEILFQAVTKTMDFTMIADMSIYSIIIVFLLVIIVYEFTKAINKRSILKVEMSEALKKGRE